MIEQFIAGFAQPLAALVLDMDHSEDTVYGQQPLAFYNHHDRSTSYLPLFIFEGLSGALITAALRPGKRLTGAENVMIMARVLKLIRRHLPDTRILMCGDGHFSTPELMLRLCGEILYTDFCLDRLETLCSMLWLNAPCNAHVTCQPNGRLLVILRSSCMILRLCVTLMAQAIASRIQS